MGILDKIRHKKVVSRQYGWKPDTPDFRDYTREIPILVEVLPSIVDLSTKCPPVLDQGNLGSCTANAIANAHRFEQKRQVFNPDWLPSRLFIYFNERAIEHTITSDSGASIRDGIKSIAKQGVCPETEWQYNIKKFKSKPSSKCYTDALKFTAIKYVRVNQLSSDIRSTLNAGYPIVFGFSVYSSFESREVANTGIVPMPSETEQCLGGHAVLMVGYDDSAQRFKVMNSWGVGWGQQGFFTIPYEYVLSPKLANDFWAIEIIK